MVVRSLVKLARLTAPKQSGGGFKGLKPDYSLPALTTPELKHHFGLIPMHAFTVLGCIVCAWYIARLCTVRDCIMFKEQTFPDIKPQDQIPLFLFGGVKHEGILKEVALPKYEP